MTLHERIKRFSDEVWNVGFMENSLDSVINGDEVKVNWIKHDCKDSWFADPFILDVSDKEIVLLVEEFYKPIYRGRISRLTIDRATNELRHLDVVLELPTHLSFPVIIRRDTDFGKTLDSTFGGSGGDYVWLMPENGASGRLNIYKYWPSGNRIERTASILDEAVEDAIPVSIGGDVYLFCTLRSNPNGKTLMTFKWHGGGRFVPYSHHDFNENVARMAGMFFTYGGELVRPTQECNVQYGHAVTLQETKLVNNVLSFHELRRMTSANSQLRVGSHTFNMYKGVIVTDALGFKNIWLRKLLKLFHIL